MDGGSGSTLYPGMRAPGGWHPNGKRHSSGNRWLLCWGRRRQVRITEPERFWKITRKKNPKCATIEGK